MIDFIKKNKFIAILRHIPSEKAGDVVKAMYEGGVRIFEVTFNPSSSTTIYDTTRIIKIIIDMYGNDIMVGAGTVINEEYAKAAYEAGAKFIVSPCTKEAVIKFTKEKGMISIPGAYTPTEIANAYELGADIVKIFPVGPTEAGYIKNVMSPLSHIPFIATGGINPDTIEEFLGTGAVAVAAGVSIVTKEIAENEKFDVIKENAKKHIEKVKL